MFYMRVQTPLLRPPQHWVWLATLTGLTVAALTSPSPPAPSSPPPPSSPAGAPPSSPPPPPPLSASACAGAASPPPPPPPPPPSAAAAAGAASPFPLPSSLAAGSTGVRVLRSLSARGLRPSLSRSWWPIPTPGTSLKSLIWMHK